MSKPKIFILGSCVSRDAVGLIEKYEISGYVARSSLASGFHDKPYLSVTDTILDQTIDSDFQKRCVRIDAQKKLPQILQETEYDFIVLDLVEERFKLIEHNNSFATMSKEFRATNLQNIKSTKKLRPLNLKRIRLWKKGLQTLLSIAKQKNVLIILFEVFPAYYDNNSVPNKLWDHIKETSRLYWFYRQIPESIIKIKVPKNLLIGDVNHQWGANPFHYTNSAYHYMAKMLEMHIDDHLNIND